ncbi:MAG: NnrU family protein [Sphingomonadaceae bacterium]
MDPALTSLLAASVAFVGTHFVLSHPLRAPLVRAIGETGFMLLYSLVAFATLGWMVLAFRTAPVGDLGGATGEIGWAIATVLTLPAMVLLFGAFWKNPALPAPGADALAASREPSGAFLTTRHPMMWGFALWAIAHIVLWWDWRTVIVAGAVLVLALVGAHLQDRKKAVLMGEGWAAWEAKTSYWPCWSQLPRAGGMLWLTAIVGWLVFTWVHISSAGVPAGIWRWVL